MRKAVVILDALMKLCGLGLLALGFFFWAGRALDLIPLHILLGAIFVLSFWAIAVLGWRAGLGLEAAALRAVWGLVVLIVGLAQSQVLPGQQHWIVQALHLLVGGIAIALGARFADRMKGRLSGSAKAAG